MTQKETSDLRKQWLGGDYGSMELALAINARFSHQLDEIERLSNGIALVLHKNRNLADGDDCTLAELKSLVPDWEARALFLTKA